MESTQIPKNIEKPRIMGLDLLLVFLISAIGMLGFLGTLNGQEWQIVTVSNEGSKPSLTVDDQGIVHMAYMYEAGNGWVRYARVQSTTVNTYGVSTGYFYGPLDITTDNQNQIYIAYHNHNLEDQVVNLGNGTTWNELRTSDFGHDGWDNSIEVDQQGIIHTSSIDPSGFGGSGLEYARYGSGGWTVEGVGSGPLMYANATSIALNPNGLPFISYYDDRAEVLKLAHKESGTWIIETVDDTPGAGLFSSLGIKPNGDMYISYFQIGGFVKLAAYENGNWSIHQIDVLDDVAISFVGARNLTSLDIYGDLIGISYADLNVCKFALWKGNVLSREYIDVTDARPFGQITSLVFDNQGVPHVAFSDLDGSMKNGNIYYARREFTVSTKEIAPAHTKLFPNPAHRSDKLFIQSSETEFDSYEIFDLSAKRIQAGNLDIQQVIEMKFINPGIYFVKLTAGLNIEVKSLVVVE